MSKEKLTWLAIGIGVGIVFRTVIDRVPLVNKIPTLS